MKRKNKLIAILGGMGPDASARLVTRIVELSREVGGAKNSDDYPNFVMQNIPVPDFFDNPKLYKTGLSLLKASVKQLAKLNPDYFAIACNTVHSLLPELREVTTIPFLDLPQLVANKVFERGYKRVGLLATPLTYQSGIYSNAFIHRNVVLVEPSDTEKAILGSIIHEILRGEFIIAQRKLTRIADSLRARRVEIIILGCTELPLVFPQQYSIPCLSSVEILASNIVIKYYDKENI